MPLTKTVSESINEEMRARALEEFEALAMALTEAHRASKALLKKQKDGNQLMFAIPGSTIWYYRRRFFGDSLSIITQAVTRLGWVGMVRGAQSGSDEKPHVEDDDG